METETIAKKVGKNLKIHIKKSKYKTQESFASIMNVDPVTIRRWIAYGVRDINTIISISKTLAIS